MKILFNCSINVVGGAVQNAANFIKYSLLCDKHQYIFIVSQEVNAVLQKWNISSNKIYAVDSPARSRAARDNIVALERGFNPDVVYTMAGPTYVKFKSPHVMGISDPYITHADRLSLFLNRSLYQALSFGLKEVVKGLYARFSADHFLFQTETSRKGFCKRFWWPVDKTSILQNALGENFFVHKVVGDNKKYKPFKIFVPSAYYSHKNLEIIFDICRFLKNSKSEKDIIFVTTAPADSSFAQRIKRFGLDEVIQNIGPYTYNDAYTLYENAGAVFIPSILETFSTSYLEAIAMEKPLIVADRSFSREVCGNYAHYYSPLSGADAAKLIFDSLTSTINVEERERIIALYGSQAQRFEKAISILEMYCKKVK